ncbi:polyprenyl synthetase family protein [Humibacter sp. RRB41]|uniref:polyprenyl synthetase family protein n=1 Tax=Humibacter sp. RRB41 TaxID=2919946 RepID=UPI0027E2C326|nr:polyprenyl synthetase family protein [Humibacter sp. RRB41]
MSLAGPTMMLPGQLAGDVEARLVSYFAEQRERARRLGVRSPALAPFELLWMEASQSARGGKKLRPALVVGAYRALKRGPERFGSSRESTVDEHSVVDVAAAFELLHTAFLLHDDVIDGDVMRRGRPNLIGCFTTEARNSGVDAVTSKGWGEACAILAGDLLIHGAHRMVDNAGLPEHLRIAVQDALDDALFVTAAGEQGDVGLTAGIIDPTFENAVAVASAKTAHYSFSEPLRAGAVLAQAEPDVVALLSDIGALIGSAFQLRDDLLGVFGDEATTGKSAEGDLANGKVTALVSFACKGASEGADCSARRLMGVGADDARALLERSGARARVEELIESHKRQVRRLARDPRLPDTVQELLEEFLQRATERES